MLIPRSIFGDVGWWAVDRQMPMLEAAPTLPNNTDRLTTGRVLERSRIVEYVR